MQRTSSLEVLAYSDSPIGAICLRRRELLASPGTMVTEITLDHMLLMSSHHTESERALSSQALARHRGTHGLRVLVGGLGLGYTAQEALKSDAVTRVDVVEFLPQVIAWMKRGLVPLSDELNSDPRYSAIEGDVYSMLAAPPELQYDLVLIDVDHSPDEPLAEANSAFYSEAGLRSAKEHIRPGGVLGVWSYAGNSPFADAIRAVFPHGEIAPVAFDNELTGKKETNWLFLAEND
ncbi:MAG: spermidine synthase [bacterium]|nr:spermidine synthase [bacterium]